MKAPGPELRHNALSLLDAVLISVAGTAPANSLAVSTAALVLAVGVFGPGAILFNRPHQKNSCRARGILRKIST